MGTCRRIEKSYGHRRRGISGNPRRNNTARAAEAADSDTTRRPIQLITAITTVEKDGVDDKTQVEFQNYKFFDAAVKELILDLGRFVGNRIKRIGEDEDKPVFGSL